MVLRIESWMLNTNVENAHNSLMQRDRYPTRSDIIVDPKEPLGLGSRGGGTGANCVY